MAENETGAPELKPTMQVYRAIVTLVSVNLQTAAGVDEFMDAAGAVACHQTGRNYIAFEQNPDYVDAAQRRIEAAQAQLTLPMVTV